ncbi:hypothetical protein ACWELB_16515 [Streptomyces asiaticus]
MDTGAVSFAAGVANAAGVVKGAARAVARAALIPTVAGATAVMVAVPSARADDHSGQVRVEDLPADTYVPEPGNDERSMDLAFSVVPKRAGRVTVVIDTSRLAGVATVGRLSDSCRREGARVTCSYRVWNSGQPSTVRPFRLRPAEGSKRGDHARVTVRASQDGSAAAGSTAVIVGLPKLTVGERGSLEHLRPGAPLPLRVAVRNAGGIPARNGFGIAVGAGGDQRITPRYRNCRKEGPDLDPELRCVFGRSLKAGESVSTAGLLGVTASKRRLYSHLSITVYALGSPDDPAYDPDERDEEPYPTTPGEDPPLGLTDASADRGRFRESLSEATVGLDRHVDLDAVARPARGRVGETVPVRVGVRARGNGDLDLSYWDQSAWSVRFTAPRGTRIVGGPEDDAQPLCTIRHGGTVAMCPESAEGAASGPGAGAGMDFRLHIDKKVHGARGRVEAVPNPDFPPHDPRPANDSAPVALETTTAAAEPETRPWLYGGTGGALVLALGVRYAVRRRTRARAESVRQGPVGT